ncbi:porin [Caldimonas thermodepolymerans]|uniref:Porin n=1 Tax=Caldimonas thermodepolymerans TaxID=215580 RepID=A0AA46DB87_9BURK|nr:porin [Caldimonas thermodepolymerans]TCP04725.1 putative porin [Caldimonas thermodepolymerans]UZG43947.1 porin [Caldimonas thermodepolymerans]UZG47615.1 porin [Caldimonas thermodepolymerans]
MNSRHHTRQDRAARHGATRRTPLGRAARIALGLGVGLAAGVAGAQSSVTMYGLVDLGLEATNGGGSTHSRMIAGGSAGSRLGFTGSEDLGGGLKATFRLEQGFTPDDGVLAQGGRAFGREASVGLASKSWGAVTMGRLLMPYYQALNPIDAFGWVGHGGVLSINRSGVANRPLLGVGLSARADNAVLYVSPNFDGFEFRVLGAFGEKSPTQGRTVSASLRYTKGPLDVVLAGARINGANNKSANGDAQGYTLGGSYDFGPARLYVGFSNEKNSCVTCTGALTRMAGVSGTNAAEFRLINVGVRVPIGAWTTYAQVVRVQDRSDYDVDPGSRDATWLAIGGQYPLSKRTMVYATLGTVDNRNGSNYALGAGTTAPRVNGLADGNPRMKGAVVGLRHSF